MVALQVCQVWWTLAYKPLRTRRHKSRRTLFTWVKIKFCNVCPCKIWSLLMWPFSKSHFIEIGWYMVKVQKNDFQNGSRPPFEFFFKLPFCSRGICRNVIPNPLSKIHFYRTICVLSTRKDAICGCSTVSSSNFHMTYLCIVIMTTVCAR